MIKGKLYSQNAVQAFENGERPLCEWTKSEILTEIKDIIDFYEIPDERGMLQRIEELDIKILQKYFLKKTAWHHVNRIPTWFYVVDEKTVIYLEPGMVQKMKAEYQKCLNRHNKPVLADIQLSKWITLPTGKQRTKHIFRTAVVFNDNAYLDNGKCYKIRDGSCVVVKEHKKIVKDKRDIFEKIIKQMRSVHGIRI